ncbi:TetR/AcrR family transcriptional regulator [Nocardia sp. XZ_19_385]|uniref:TetR/AcrR family transcriptional regulator n=1 Tax=Nocardia sp. XZ_19_385 TaxID=2769488 RepID=UPI00189051B6|nr:TetR/AcrR family transcriptional regulator [Nocardia sp. XZ_19_385]
MAHGPDGQALISPARGTRPANRRELIVRAATDLFYRKGYATVGMGEVAEAVAIGPSALYRHFRGKQDLLATVVGDALGAVDARLAASSSADVGVRLAGFALEHRGIGVLWRREARHLSADNRAELRVVTDRIVTRLTDLIRERRPTLGLAEADLLARSALAVGISASFHSLSLPEPGFTNLLGELITTTIDAPIALADPMSGNPDAAATVLTRSRRETILVEASKLFARNGFAGVSMDDIGAAVGIAGPSVYNHFPAKTDILTAAMFRGDEWLRMGMNRAFAQATDPRDALRRLLRSYGEFVFENPDLIQLLISESVHLPEADRHRTRVAQHSYIAEWVHLADQVHPSWDHSAARIRVQAAQTILNEISLTPQFRMNPAVESAVCVISAELLAIQQD